MRVLSKDFTRPSLAEYSGGFYQEVKSASEVPSMRPTLAQEWQIPRSDDGEIDLLGVKLRPAAKANVKVFFGDKANKAAAWADAYPTTLVRLHHECYGVKFLEQQDNLTDEELAPYSLDSRTYGQLRISWKGVNFSVKDGVASAQLNEPEKYLSWCSSSRFQVGDVDAVYKEIASRVDSAAPRRVFVQCDWQLLENDGTELTPRESAFLTINKDLSVVAHSSRQELIDVAVAALQPVVQSRYDQAVRVYQSGNLEFNRFCSGPEPWREASQNGWTVRTYLNRGSVERVEISASALSPW